MRVKELIEELKKLPQDAYIASYDDINWSTKDDPHDIKIVKHTWVHSNYPYDKPDFDYYNLE